MDFRDKLSTRAISLTILFFFCWSFSGGVDIAWAIKNSDKLETASSGLKNQKTNASQQPKQQGPEEKFQKAIEAIERILADTVTDTDTKKNKLKGKKSEIESFDIEIKKQFAGTEKKLKDEGLPTEILDRHYKFVRHYEDNLKELKKNLEAIDKAKNRSEIEKEIEKTKAHLEKVNPPKRHKPLDPDKLPHRSAEPVFIEPRTTPEEFQKDREALAVNSKVFKDQKNASRFTPHDSPILVASNGPLRGLLSPDTSRNKSLRAQGEAISQTTLFAAANPPSPADLTQTIEVQFTPAITAKAAELGHNPVKIYNWVRNNIEYVPTYGSIQGADMCLQTKQCNDFDTASLLIALLRASGIYARYVYGTIELPIEKVMNWVGGFTDPMAALNFIASGGIPVKGLTSGGKIVNSRMEHVWVEAYVDMIPSQGAVHKQGDTWVPLDPSFKQYGYTQGIDIKTAVPFNAQAFVDQIQATATINETEGYVTGVNSLFIQQTMTDYQTQVQNYITQHYPNATVGDVLGKKDIVKQEFPVLMGTLPYKMVVKGATYSSLPDSLRHKITFSVIKDIYDEFGDTPINITKNLPELAGKKITLSYSPATQADENVINRYLPKPHTDGTPIQPSELPTSLPAYLINVKPELRVDGTVVATGNEVGLGSIEKFDMTFIHPVRGSDTISNTIAAGEYYGISVNVSSISQKQLQNIKGKIEATKEKLATQDFTQLTKDDILGDLLYAVALTYNAKMDTYDTIQAKMIGVISVRVPSEAIFKSAIEVGTSFGLPISISAGGLMMDVDRNLSLVNAIDGINNKKLQFLTVSGMTSSALEHRVPEQLYTTPDNAVEGISAVKALQIASSQGIPVYKVTKDNINSVLPHLQLDVSVINDIRNAVNAGNEVTVSKTNINFHGWMGCGYLVFNPATGSGAYMLSGGQSGAAILQIGAGIMWVLFSLPLLIFPPAGVISILVGITVILDGIKKLVDAAIGFYKDVTWDFYYNDYNGFDWCIAAEVIFFGFALISMIEAIGLSSATALQTATGGVMASIATIIAAFTLPEDYCIILRSK